MLARLRHGGSHLPRTSGAHAAHSKETPAAKSSTATAPGQVPENSEPYSVFYHSEDESKMLGLAPAVVRRVELYLTDLFTIHAPDKRKNIGRLGQLLSMAPTDGGLALRKLSNRMRGVYGVDMEMDLSRELRDNAIKYLTAHAGKVGRSVGRLSVNSSVSFLICRSVF